MLFTVFIVHWIVLQTTITSQPVNENNFISNSPQNVLEECCPCPKFIGDIHLRDQEFSPTSTKTTLFRTPDDKCQFTDPDSQGSSSIFRPFLLRTAQPVEWQRDPNQVIKPLLQPEVGLASSVLETLQKATDEEYKDALARDIARSAVKIEPDSFDTETGNSRNSVTIVLSPRDNLFIKDTIPEASHIHETRCIHRPLGRENMVGGAHMVNPNLSKDLILKRKPINLSRKSYDMDNSASNIQERFYSKYNNGLSSKLKMNPLLLNTLANDVIQQFRNNSYLTSDSGYTSESVSTQYYEDIDQNNNNDKLNNSPAVRLATLRNKLRDLNEMRQIKPFKNNLNTAKPNHLNNFNYKIGYPGAELENFESGTKSLADTFFDKQNAIVKTILKLKDVELIPPNKAINNGIMRDQTLHANLKFASPENNDSIFLTSEHNISEDKIDENDIIINDNYSNKLSSDQKAREIDTKIDDESKDSCEISQIITELENSKNGISNEIEQFKDVRDESGQKEMDLKDNFENKSKEDLEGIDDAVPEMSNNVLQKSSQTETNTMSENSNVKNSNNGEEVCQLENFLGTESALTNVQKNILAKNDNDVNLLRDDNDDHVSFTKDVLKRVENLKKSIKSKLQDSGRDLRPISKINLENNQDTQSLNSLQRLEGKHDVTMDDLQKYSDSLLKQEKLSTSNSVFLSEIEYKRDDDFVDNSEHCANELKDDKRSSVSDKTEKLIDNLTSKYISDDDESNFNSQPIVYQISGKVCDISNENFETLNTENYLSQDYKPINEMSSQASDFIHSTIRATENKNNLVSSLQSNIIVQPSDLSNIINPFKNTLQIPSLEEIRQGITDIISAGEQEGEEFQSAISDPLNESSNHNPLLSANTNLLSEKFKMGSLQNILENSSVMRHNINPYKPKLSIAKPVPLKFKLNPLLNNEAGMKEDILSFGPSKAKSFVKPNLKLSSNSLGISLKEIPSLANIEELLQNQSSFKPNIEFPRANIDKIAIFSPQIITSIADDIKYQSNNVLKSNLKEAKEGKFPLSKTKVESNRLLENINKRREDLNDKIQVLHTDFNDRLASVQEKFLDQPHLQSMNIFKTEGKSKSLTLPGFVRDVQAQNQFFRNLNNIERNLPLTPSHLTLQKKIKNNKNPPLKVSLPVMNINDKKQNLRKKSYFTPLKSSNVNIYFSTTTTRPIMNPKLQKKPVLKSPTKKPLKVEDKYSDLVLNLKGISKPYYHRFKTLGDTSNAPSELIQTTIPLLKDFTKKNEESISQIDLSKNNLMLKSTNTDKESGFSDEQQIIYNNPHFRTLLESSQVSDLSNKKENFISNMRDTLRARLSHITNAPKATIRHETKNADPSNSDTMVLSSENVKTSLINNALQENTAYKCSMICVRD